MIRRFGKNMLIWLGFSNPYVKVQISKDIFENLLLYMFCSCSIWRVCRPYLLLEYLYFHYVADLVCFVSVIQDRYSMFCSQQLRDIATIGQAKSCGWVKRSFRFKVLLSTICRYDLSMRAPAHRNLNFWLAISGCVMRLIPYHHHIGVINGSLESIYVGDRWQRA